MRHAKPTAGAPAILRPFASGAEAPTVLPPARQRTPVLPCISGAARGHAAASTPETSPALGAAAPPEPTSANRADPPTRPTGSPSPAAPGKSAPVAAGGVQWRHGAPIVTAEPAGAPSRPQLGNPIKRILRDIRPRARVLALVSGKGGVGKTNLAVNLAIGLAAVGQRVLLVDADLGLANVDLLLGQRPRGDLGHVLAGRLPLEEIVQEGVAGIRWISGASHIEGIARRGDACREAFLESLSALETRYDFVLFDGPAGL
jgi:Mrp family chromosome partitioning ATPase